MHTKSGLTLQVCYPALAHCTLDHASWPVHSVPPCTISCHFHHHLHLMYVPLNICHTSPQTNTLCPTTFFFFFFFFFMPDPASLDMYQPISNVNPKFHQLLLTRLDLANPDNHLRGLTLQTPIITTFYLPGLTLQTPISLHSSACRPLLAPANLGTPLHISVQGLTVQTLTSHHTFQTKA